MLKTKSRVFIAERPRQGIDIDRAGDFGEVFVISEHFETRLTAYELCEYVDAVERFLREHNFDPIHDYFCVVGPVLPISVVTAVLCRMFDQITLLCYKPAAGRYVQRILDMKKVGTHERVSDGSVSDPAGSAGAAS